MGAPAVGDVVLVRFPFSDLSTTKRRPAFVAATAGRSDVVLCQITSQQYASRSAREIAEAETRTSGLRRRSYVRPDKLFTAHSSLVSRRLGSLSAATTRELRSAVAALFT